MSKLDDILIDYFGANWDTNKDGKFVSGLFEPNQPLGKQAIKELMQELVKQEQANWDKVDDQEASGYTALEALSETIERL